MPAWTYSWTTTTPTLTSDTGSGTVTITPDPGTGATPAGATGLVAGNIMTNSGATSVADSLNASGAYKLFLTVNDTASVTSHTFEFDGKLSGTFSQGSSLLTNEFMTGPQSFNLGSTQYTASMVSYLHPGPPGSGNPGAFGASVSVVQLGPDGKPVITGINSPEPASLLLCSLGAAGCAFAGWRRRRTPAGSTSGL